MATSFIFDGCDTANQQQNAIITVRIPLEVKSGENICDINPLFGEVKSQREKKNFY